MSNQKHIINKVFVEVNAPDTQTAFYLKDNIDTFLKQNLFPELESYFNTLMKQEYMSLRIDNVELNIDCSNINDEVQLQQDILKSLQQQLLLMKDLSALEIPQLSSVINKRDNDVNSFLYFLKTGQNPWWDTDFEQNILNETFIAQLTTEKSFNQNLKELLRHHTIQQRLIYQLTDELLARILFPEQDFRSNESKTKNAILLIKKYLTSRSLRNLYWELIIQYRIDDNLFTLEKNLSRLLTTLYKELSKKPIPVNEVLLAKIKQLADPKNKIINQLRTGEKNEQKAFRQVAKIIIEAYKKIKHAEIDGITKEVSSDTSAGLTGKLANALTIDKVLLSVSSSAHFKQPGNRSPIDKEILRQLIGDIIEAYNNNRQNELNAINKDFLSLTSDLISKQVDVYQNKDQEIRIKDVEVEKNVEAPEKPLEVNNEVYIKNAGLVLLHPYLSQFFSTTKLADGHGNLNSEKIELAIHLLHYVATKKEQQAESSLVFEKFLCGVPLETPIQRAIKLPKNLKQESETLLRSVLQNWKVLKNTSPDGLREGFLQRDGKIIRNDPSKYKVIVERKTMDILLDHLPWNLSLVKLPWIDRLIFVEW